MSELCFKRCVPGDIIICGGIYGDSRKYDVISLYINRPPPAYPWMKVPGYLLAFDQNREAITLALCDVRDMYKIIKRKQ